MLWLIVFRDNCWVLWIFADMSAVGGGVSAKPRGGGTGEGSEGLPWPTGAGGYKLDKMIGKGAFATVWKAFCASRGVHVAVKVMDLENVTHSFEDIRQEVGIFYGFACV